jgi:glycogen operon protein
VRRGEGEPVPDIVWLKPDADPMTPEDWESGFGRTIGVYLNGQGIRGRDARGERIVDRHFLVYFSAHDEDVQLTLPDADYAAEWDVMIDTSGERVGGDTLMAGAACDVGAHSLLVLCEHQPDATTDGAVTVSPELTAIASSRSA